MSKTGLVVLSLRCVAPRRIGAAPSDLPYRKNVSLKRLKGPGTASRPWRVPIHLTAPSPRPRPHGPVPTGQACMGAVTRRTTGRRRGPCATCPTRRRSPPRGRRSPGRGRASPGTEAPRRRPRHAPLLGSAGTWGVRGQGVRRLPAQSLGARGRRPLWGPAGSEPSGRSSRRGALGREGPFSRALAAAPGLDLWVGSWGSCDGTRGGGG